MRKSKVHNSKLVAYIGYPILFMAVTVLLYIAGGRTLINMIIDDVKLAVIQGAPEYAYDENQTLEPKEDGIIKNGDVKLPSMGLQFGQIQCESVGFKAPLYYGDSEQILSLGVGVYTGSSLPGQGSIILAGGHDTTFCKPLQDMAVNDVIAVTTMYGSYTYKVTSMKTADLMDQTAYQLKTDKETLILYTCFPFGDVSSERTQRYYVYAEKVTGPELQEE